MAQQSADLGGGGGSERPEEHSSSKTDHAGIDKVDSGDHDFGESVEEASNIVSAIAEAKENLMAALRRMAEDQELSGAYAQAEKAYSKAATYIDRAMDIIEVLEVVSAAAEAYQQGQDAAKAARDVIESKVREDRESSPYLDKIFNDVVLHPRPEYY